MGTGEVGRLLDAATIKDEQLEKLQKEIKSLHLESDKLKESLLQAEEEHKTQLDTTKHEAEDAVNSVKKENKKLEQEKESFRKEIHELNSKNIENSKESAELHTAEVAKLNQTITKKEAAINDLEGKLQGMREDMLAKESGADTVLNEIQLEKTKLKAQIEELEKQKLEFERKDIENGKELKV